MNFPLYRDFDKLWRISQIMTLFRQEELTFIEAVYKMKYQFKHGIKTYITNSSKQTWLI